MTTPLAWLRSFEAAARLGSFSSAGDALGLTQAAVSQQIKSLEGRLRAQLFVRQSRGVTLTGAGTELFRDVSSGLNLIDGAVERLVRREEHNLTILCNSSFAIRHLQPRLSSFIAAHPTLAIAMRTTLWRTDAIGVKADVDIFHGPANMTGNALQLAGGELVAVAPPWLCESETGIPMQDARLIRAKGYESLFDEWALEIREKRLERQPVYECDSFQLALYLAEEGVGITIAPRLLAQEAVSKGRLVMLHEPQKLPAMAYWCATSDTASNVTQSFVEWLIETCTKSTLDL